MVTTTVSAGVTSSGLTFTPNNTAVVSGTAEGFLISGGLMQVKNGGLADDTFIFSGGSATISAGASVTDTTIYAGGKMTVGKSAEASGTVLSGGVETVAGSAIGTVVFAGGVQSVTSGEADGTILSSGGAQTLSGSTAVAVGTVIMSGASESLWNAAALSLDATVSSGGVLLVSKGDATATTVLSGGIEVVMSGGMANDTILDGGTLVALPGAIVDGTKGGDVTSTGVLTLTTAPGGASFSASYAASLSGVTITAPASGSQIAYVLESGTLIDAVISGPGTALAYVYSGGKVTNTAVRNGTVTVYSGGVANDTSVSSGFLTLSGGTASGVIVSGNGARAVYNSAITTDTSVYAGGQAWVNPGTIDTNTRIFSGGGQSAQQTTVINATVYNGGIQLLMGGTTTSGTIVSSGGLQVVSVFNTTFGSNTVIGTQVLSGGRIVIDSGSLISGLEVSSGGSIDINFLTYDSANSVDLTSGGLLTVSNGGSTLYQLQLSGTYGGSYFHTSQDNDGSLILTEDNNPCYCPGTLITTDKGEIAVEDLVIGDRVINHKGEPRAIKWIGHRSYAGRFVAMKGEILPICFKAGSIGETSLGENLPRRDLWVSPHHAMYLNGVLIEAKDLVNGLSIYQATSADSVIYFHIELDSHDVIIAEGVFAESFVDDNGRGMFHNEREFYTLYPDAERTSAQRYYAPRIDCGEEVETARAALDARADACFGIALKSVA